MSNDSSIDIRGIDKARLLVELVHGTQPRGLGELHAYDLGLDQAREILRAADKFDGGIRLDYVAGRPIKIVFTADDRILRTELYDRDAGEGACAAAVERARIGPRPSRRGSNFGSKPLRPLGAQHASSQELEDPMSAPLSTHSVHVPPTRGGKESKP